MCDQCITGHLKFRINKQWRIQGEGDGGDRPSQDGKINMGEIGVT